MFLVDIECRKYSDNFFDNEMKIQENYKIADTNIKKKFISLISHFAIIKLRKKVLPTEYDFHTTFTITNVQFTLTQFNLVRYF